MNKLEPNMYVKTNEGKITKLKSINECSVGTCYYFEDDVFESIGAFGIEYQKTLTPRLWKFYKDKIRYSYNIKELLEVGDVIKFEIKTQLETSGKLKGITDITDEEMLKEIKNNENYHILSILTKEMFSSMEYKLGDEIK